MAAEVLEMGGNVLKVNQSQLMKVVSIVKCLTKSIGFVSCSQLLGRLVTCIAKIIEEGKRNLSLIKQTRKYQALYNPN